MLLLVACGAPPASVPAPSPETYRPPARVGRTFALLVGCTDYPLLAQRLDPRLYQARVRLEGPGNDVVLMRDTLIHVLGFDEEKIMTLTGWPADPAQRPSRKNIETRLERLRSTVTNGDRVVILFAGHGVQQPDKNGDELDGQDEVFLPADAGLFDPASGEIPGALADDRLGRWIRAIRDAGAFVWVIMDTCHSGTMARGAPAVAMAAATHPTRFRQIDRALLGLPERRVASRGAIPAHGAGPRLELEDLHGIAAFYAAQSLHKAPEMPLPPDDPNAPYHGLLTFMIARQLSRFGGRLTFRELLARTVASYQALPFKSTVPLAEGDLGRRIGTTTMSGATTATDSLSPPSLLVGWRDGKLVLNAGRLIGLDTGTVLEAIEPADESGIAPTGRDVSLGRIEIVAAGVVESVCRPLSDILMPGGSPRDGAVYRVRVLRRPVSARRLRIGAVAPNGSPIPNEQLFEREPGLRHLERDRFSLVDDPSEADWLIVCRQDDLWLQPVQTGGGGGRYDPGPGGLCAAVRRIARARNLVWLAGSGLIDPLEAGLEVRLERIRPDGTITALEPGAAFEPGDSGRVLLRNGTGKTYDVTILFIDAAFGIRVFFPTGGRTARLTSADRAPVQAARFFVNDQSLGVEHLLVIAIPREASSKEINLSWLAQGALGVRTRGERSSPTDLSLGAGGDFGRALYELAFGSGRRSIKLVPNTRLAPTMELFTWRTLWPPAAPPRTWPGGGPSPGPGHIEVRMPVRLPDELPPCSIGPNVALARSGAGDGGTDLLLGGRELPRQVFIDVDADTFLRLAPKMWPPTVFDAEAAFFFSEHESVAFYDTRNQGIFDLILVDLDRDGQADLSYTLRDGRWSREEDAALPWLSTGYLTFLAPTRSPSGGPDHLHDQARRDAVRRFSLLAQRAVSP